MDTLKKKAMADVKRILLPEGEEPRTVQAASLIAKQKIADVVLIGDEVNLHSQETTDLSLELDGTVDDGNVFCGQGGEIDINVNPGLRRSGREKRLINKIYTNKKLNCIVQNDIFS